MAKLVAYTGSQAAAGLPPPDLMTRLVSPAGIAAIAGTAASGWVLGSVVGQALRDDKPLWEADVVPGHLPSDLEEFLAVWGVAGASVLSLQLLQGLAREFGWKMLGLYTLGLGAIVLYRRT